MAADEYGSESGNGTKARPLKRMKLSFNGAEVQFAINPEDYTQSIPNRVTVTQTKGGAWLDAWGAGIVEITIKGTTGVKGSSGTDIDIGYQRWRQLRALITDVFNSVQDGEEVSELIAFYNYTDNEYWYCYPAQGGIELYRSKSRPHMYQYTIHLLGIREIGQPATSSGVIGNPNAATATSGNNITSVQPGIFDITYGQGDVTMYSLGTKTRAKSQTALQADSRMCAEQLAPIIGGSKGKIVPATGYQCTQGLTIAATGDISNINKFIGNDLVDTFEEQDTVLIAEAKFIPKIDTHAYQMVQKMKEYSPEVLDPSYGYVEGNTIKQRVIRAVVANNVFESSLYELILAYKPKSILSKSEILRLKMIMLDCMNVYREVYSLKDQEGAMSTSLTVTSVSILADNIAALILYFTLTPSNYDLERMDVIALLRDLYESLIQLITNVINYL